MHKLEIYVSNNRHLILKFTKGIDSCEFWAKQALNKHKWAKM